MNLVAKEFVTAQVDEQGMLILSQFTAAAIVLPDALIINPYNTAPGPDHVPNRTTDSHVQHARHRAGI